MVNWAGLAAQTEVEASLDLNTLHFMSRCNEKDKGAAASPADLFTGAKELELLPPALRQRWEAAHRYTQRLGRVFRHVRRGVVWYSALV